MGTAVCVVGNDLFARIRNPDGDIAKRVTVREAVRFCEDTMIINVETPLLPDDPYSFHGCMDIIIEDDGTIRFKRDADV